MPTVHTYCDLPFKRLKVTSEGDATMCCFMQRKALGNILVHGVREIWDSKLAEEIRTAAQGTHLHAVCAAETCPLIPVRYELENRRIPIQYDVLPCQLEIDLPSQHCNVGGVKPNEQNPACLMCERYRHFVPQQDRLDEICQALRPYTPLFTEVHIQGIAEPFWKNRVFELINTLGIRDYADDIRVTTTTNGTILSEERIDWWLQLPVSTITFSIDAATPETYRKLRRLDVYRHVIDNLKRIASLRNRPHQVVQIHNNINILNVGEVVGMVEVAAEADVDYLDFNPTYNTPDICVNESNVGLFREAQREIVEAADRLGVRVTFTRPLTLDFDIPQIPVL